MKNVILGVFTAILLFACAESPDPKLLVGKWIYDDGQLRQLFAFDSTGNYESTYVSPYISSQNSGKYKVSGNTIEMVDKDDMNYTEKFKFSNENLIIIRKDAEVLFKKIQ